eukprot:59752-Prorocentrum_minimum.AAC.1
MASGSRIDALAQLDKLVGKLPQFFPDPAGVKQEFTSNVDPAATQQCTAPASVRPSFSQEEEQTVQANADAPSNPDSATASSVQNGGVKREFTPNAEPAAKRQCTAPSSEEAQHLQANEAAPSNPDSATVPSVKIEGSQEEAENPALTYKFECFFANEAPFYVTIGGEESITWVLAAILEEARREPSHHFEVRLPTRGEDCTGVKDQLKKYLHFVHQYYEYLKQKPSLDNHGVVVSARTLLWPRVTCIGASREHCATLSPNMCLIAVVRIGPETGGAQGARIGRSTDWEMTADEYAQKCASEPKPLPSCIFWSHRSSMKNIPRFVLDAVDRFHAEMEAKVASGEVEEPSYGFNYRYIDEHLKLGPEPTRRLKGAVNCLDIEEFGAKVLKPLRTWQMQVSG